MVFFRKLILSSLRMSLVSSILSSGILQRDTYVSSELKFTFYYSYYCCILTHTLINHHSFVHFIHFSSTGNAKTMPATRQWRRGKKSQRNFKMQKNYSHDMKVTANTVFFPKQSPRHLFIYFFSAAILRTCWSTAIIVDTTSFSSQTVLNEDLWKDVSWLQ